MSSSKSISMAAKVGSQPTCHLMRLPTEIREMIYRPLVIARFVMVEHRMNSKEYDRNWREIQDGPDQKYLFETAILATNRRIHEEVKELCRRENDFVRLTSRQPSRVGFELNMLGLQMIATRSRARMFWNISMTLTLDPPMLSGWPRQRTPEPWWRIVDRWEEGPEDGRPWSYIFYRDELPEFCRLLPGIPRTSHNFLRETVLYVDINSAFTNGDVQAVDGHPAGRARLERLLGPLRRLHGLGAAQIDGPLSGSYKGGIIRDICKHCPTAMDIVHETIASLEQADEHAGKGQLQQANSKYKAALSLVRSCCWQPGEWNSVMSDGPFPGLRAREVVNNIEARLQARIAGVYYKSSELRMARIYTERALAPRRPYPHRHDKIYDEFNIRPWEYIVYAEVLHVAARISYAHGDVFEAIRSLSQAGEYVPFDEEQQSRCETWQAHADRLRAVSDAREKAKKIRLEQQHKKTEAMIGVVDNWKRKGERLFRSGRSYLAASVYETALKKLDLLKHNRDLYFRITSKTFQGRNAEDATKVLAFKIEANLAAALLKSRTYKEVVTQTAAALRCDNKYHNGQWPRHSCCSDSYCYWPSLGDWMDDQKFELLRLHYCRAMALYHLGDMECAEWHMEEAHRLDPGDNDVYEKLTMLRHKLAEEAAEAAAARELRLEKLNISQNQLRKKQARRRMKA